MTVALAASYREKALNGDIDVIADDVKIAAIGPGYVYDPLHDFLADVSDIVVTSGNLTGKTDTDGYFGADPASFGSPAAGDNITQFWVYRDTGSSATSDLVLYFNEDATGETIDFTTTGQPLSLILQALGLFRL